MDSRLTAACLAQIESMTPAKTHDGPGACAAIVRIDAATHALEGYDNTCGPYATVYKEQARQLALTTTGFGVSDRSLTAVDQQAFVFLDGPPDPAGVAIVSSTLGQVLFGASLGGGGITYPATWRPISALDPGCIEPSGGYPIGFDLVNDGATLPANDTQVAWNIAQGTGIHLAMYGITDILGVIVLRYAPTVQSDSKWIVVVAGGWLE